MFPVNLVTYVPGCTLTTLNQQLEPFDERLDLRAVVDGREVVRLLEPSCVRS